MTAEMRNQALALAVTALLLVLLCGLAPGADLVSIPGGLITPQPASGERCDNCMDDDGDGLSDVEDPACCPLLGTLDVRRARVERGRLDLRATLPLGFDPRGHAVRLIVSREAGPLVCREIVTPGARGRAAAAVALRRTVGERWGVRAIVPLDTRPSGAMRVTLRVGEACFAAIAVLDLPRGRLLP